MYRIPKFNAPKPETIPVLTAHARKTSTGGMAQTLNRSAQSKIEEEIKQPPIKNLSASLDPRGKKRSVKVPQRKDSSQN